MKSSHAMLVALASIFVLGTGAQWLAWRLKIPAIILLLVVGCLAGSVSGFINPEEVFGDLLLPLVSLSVGLILFEGGLNLRLRELSQTWRSLLGLLIIGVIVTWAGATMAGILILNLPRSVALILGAVLTVTGPTVIGPLLREIRPSGRVGAISKWEGIIVDPIGATLAVLVFEVVDSIRSAQFGQATQEALSGLAIVTATGLSIGLAAAAILVVMLKKYWIPDHLHNPMALMFVCTVYTTSELIHHEAGLLATTVMGIAMANQRWVSIHRIMEFKESLTVLLISMLFIVLSARVPISSVFDLGWRGIAFAGALIIVIRPLAVWASTIGSGLTASERLFLCWFAPRGIVAAAVSSVFALRMGPSGAAIAPATFIVIISTVTIYGITSKWLAVRLKLSIPNAQGILIGGGNQFARAIASVLQREGIQSILIDSRFDRVQRARNAGLSACFANILSEHVLNQVDFGGLGRFMALTSNDEVNTLAMERFRELFGSSNVYQLNCAEKRYPRLEPDRHRSIGRMLFAPQLTYEFIDNAMDEGALIKVTRLTETFDLKSFQEHYKDRAWPLFLIEAGRLTIMTCDSRPVLKTGQAVVSLVLPSPSESTRQDAPENQHLISNQ